MLEALLHKNFTHLPPRVILSAVSAVAESLFDFYRAETHEEFFHFF